MTRAKVELLENEAPPQTASARILADANHIEYEVDKRGRRIGVKKLTYIQIHRLKKIVGAETAANIPAFTDVVVACSVAEIDGDPVPWPGTNLQIEALITRIDLDGLAAINEAFERLNPKEGEDAEIKN